MKKWFKIVILSLFVSGQVMAQDGIVDEIVAIVGDKIVLRSDVDVEYFQLSREIPDLSPDLKCEILNQKIVEQLLLYKAQLDSVEVGEDRVEGELDKRIRYFVNQIGSEKALEEYYGRSILEIKSQFRGKIQEQILIQDMQSRILADVKVSPTEVKKFFNSIPKDSLPRYSAEVEVGQIVMVPKVSPEQKVLALEKITDIRKRILAGEDFCTMAILYSMDQGTRSKCGELGYFGRGEMVPQFEAMAFKLKNDTVSNVIESKFGYHILKRIDRKGDRVNVRHILIKPDVISSDLTRKRKEIDSVYHKIKAGVMTFPDAAKKYSEDEQTKSNGGFFTDYTTGSTKIPYESLEKPIYNIIKNMKPGDVSQIQQIALPDGSKAYRMVYLKSESDPHVANLRDDYQKIQAMATQQKQQETLNKWVDRYKSKYYINIKGDYASCPNLDRWKQKKR